MTYNTGNPLGSKDPRDLYDNAENFDKYVNGADPFYPSRFSQMMLSIAGMNQQFNSAQTGRAAQFEAQLAAIGYVWLGDYGPGITFTSRNQYMVRDGLAYTVATATTLPYTSTGNWATEVGNFKLVPVDNILRTDLAQPDGASLIGIPVAFDGSPGTVADVVGKTIFRDLTVTVPGDFTEPALAMDWLRDKTINAGVLVTIQLTASWTPTKSTILNHVQGQQIRILGNASNPTAIHSMATSPLSFDAFICTNGYSFGLLDNFVVDAAAKSEAPLNYSGIVADRGVIICGKGMTVNNYYYSYAARYGGIVFADETKAYNAGDVAYWAFNGGHVRARNAYGENVRDVANGLGFVFQAEYGGTLDCSGATAKGGLVAGIAALSGGAVRAYNSITTANDGAGYLARDMGVIVAHNGSATLNGTYGISQITTGRVLGNGITLTGNVAGSIKPVALLDNDTLGARILGSGGSLRIDTGSGGYSTFFNSSGGLQFAINNTDSAVNCLNVTGGVAGNFVRIGAQGTDANISINVATKGTGTVNMSGAWNGGHLCLGVNHLWVDAAGRLRIKSSAPTSDTDGTIVGTQT